MQQESPYSAAQLSDAHTILDSITDAFFSLNERWEFSYVNRQTLKTLAREAEELLGKSIWEVYPGTVGSEFERTYRRAAQERVALAFCSYYPDHQRWYDVNVYPTPGGLSVYFRDVTARRQEEIRRNAVFTLTDLFRDLSSSEQIIYQASRILGETLGVSRVGYGTVDPVAETLHVVRDWNAPGVATLAGVLRLRDYGSFIDDLKAGRFIFIDDVERDPRTASSAAALRGRSAASFVNVPVMENNRLVAVIFVNHAQVRHWSPEELAFIRDVAERTRDASERVRNAQELAKVVEESERRRRLYETFLDNSPDLAYVFDLQHRFTYANRVLLAMWGRSWDDAIGKSCLELGYEPWHAEMHDREIEQVVAARQPVMGEVPFNGTNGRRIYEYIFVPVLAPDGTVEAIAGTTRDVTERRHALDGLSEANRRKDEFLAMLAHELRNPLAPISAAAEVLQLKASDEKLTRRSSEIIGRQVRHMTALVDDLLDVSRVTRGLVTLSRSALDVKAVVHGAVEQVRPLIESRRHQLSFDLAAEPTYVMGDQKRLVQIVSNLLNNAAKYTPPGGAIQLRLTAEPAQLVLTIEDNGAGIPAALQPDVFELFVQADTSLDRTQGGLGIGLALVKNLTELHGGTVGCFSAGKDQGSQFTVVLPRCAAPADQMADGYLAEPLAPGTNRPLCILLVDDNRDAAHMLALYLDNMGHRVLVEHSSHDALVRVQTERPDVCILDIGLPDIDGNQLAQRLRLEPHTATALLIAVTGYGQEQDRRNSLAAGFDEHLVKPVDVGMLANVLRRHRR